jgi:multimeric flavodoxin WrbA
MKILILDGNPDTKNEPFEEDLAELDKEMQKLDHEVRLLNLRDLNIRYCTGCFGCWVQTPGKCVFPDDSEDVCREYINSDFVLMASTVKMGFTTALLKKTQDRLIGLLHPDFDFVENETHHRRRYNEYPKIGLLLEKSPNTDDEDIQIIRDMFRRFCLNFKTELTFFGLTAQDAREIARAIDAI